MIPAAAAALSPVGIAASVVAPSLNRSNSMATAPERDMP
jgi:hypothetical protein